MKKITPLVLLPLLAAFLLFLNSSCQPKEAEDPDCKKCTNGNKCDDRYFTQLPFPAQYDYMPGSDSFDIWVNRGIKNPGHRMRIHAWNLWAGLNQPANDSTDRVIWQTWMTATQAYQDSTFGRGRPIMQKLKHASDYPTQDSFINRTPPAYQIPECLQQKYGVVNHLDSISVDGCRFQFNGDLMVAGVIYNKPAYNWIRSKTNPLYLKSTLNRLVHDGYTDIPGFPDSSFVLKPMMWPIKQDGFTALPVWDNLSPDSTAGNTTYAGFENQDFWKRAVAITPGPTSAAYVDSIRFLYSVNKTNSNQPLVNIYRTNTTDTVKVVNLQDNFYYWQIGEDELNKMSCQDRLILDMCAWWTYGRAFEANDYLALVAMHMFSKEFPDWTMQTAWWHDHPDTSRFATHRPVFNPPAKGPWDHYLMVSTYGQPQQLDTINRSVLPNYCNTVEKTEACWPVAYNPYIELGGLHPIATNCRNCHIRAGWTKDSTATNYLAEGGPSSLQYFDTTNTLLFNNVIRTDFQWAIPDRVLPHPADDNRNQ